VDQGISRKEVSRVFGVSLASIKRYIKQRREIGSLAPRTIPGRPPRKIGPLQKGLQPQLEAHPDATLEEHCKLWEAETGIKVSVSTMSRAILRLKWTWKKKMLDKVERKEEEREKWRELVKDLDASKIRVIDETGSNIALTRLYGRAPKGKRGKIVRKRGKNVPMITDLSLQGLGEKFIMDGSANGDIFEAYIEQIFAPTLKSGEIVIMDNLSIGYREKEYEISSRLEGANSCICLLIRRICPQLKRLFPK
jgi:transposase